LAARPTFDTLEDAELSDWRFNIVVEKVRDGLLVMAVVAVAALIVSAVQGEEDFPISGTYTKDASCQGDAAKREDLRVRITGNKIESNMGVCTILHRKRDGRTVAAQIECKVPGDQVILGDVTFTLRDDNAIDFDDQDHTSPAVLYRCAN
jgi:hypothetical protein